MRVSLAEDSALAFARYFLTLFESSLSSSVVTAAIALFTIFELQIVRQHPHDQHSLLHRNNRSAQTAGRRHLVAGLTCASIACHCFCFFCCGANSRKYIATKNSRMNGNPPSDPNPGKPIQKHCEHAHAIHPIAQLRAGSNNLPPSPALLKSKLFREISLTLEPA